MSSPLTARTAAFVGAGTLVLNAATFLVYFGVARLTTHAAYGDIFALLSAVFIAYIPAVVASITIARRIAIIAVSGGPAATARIERSVLRRTYAVALPVLVGGVVWRAPIAAVLQVADAAAVGWAAAALVLSVTYQIQRGMLQGLEQYPALARSYALEGAGRLVIGLLGTSLFGEAGFFAGASVALALVVAHGSVELIRHRAAAGSMLVPSEKGGAAGTIATAAAMSIVTVLSLYDAILTKRWFTPDSAGLYASAAVVGRATYSTVAFIPGMLLPRLVHLNSRDRSTTRVLLLGLVATAAPMLVVTAAVTWLPHLVIGLTAGPSFAMAAPYALPLALAASALALTNLGTTFLIARGHFAVVPWLIAAGVAELTFVSLAHRTLGQVAWTVCVGHCVTLLVAGAAVLASRERRPFSE